MSSGIPNIPGTEGKCNSGTAESVSVNPSNLKQTPRTKFGAFVLVPAQCNAFKYVRVDTSKKYFYFLPAAGNDVSVGKPFSPHSGIPPRNQYTF